MSVHELLHMFDQDSVYDFAEVHRRCVPMLDKVIYEGLLDYERVCAREFTSASSMDSIQAR